MKNVLVVAAHPDDEVLGCGGTIARHAREGDAVHVVILAEGATSRDATRNPRERTEELSELARAANASKQTLGISSLVLHEFPDNRMDSVDRLDIIKVIETHINKLRPAIIYTHHGGDLNIDHQIVHEAVATACRPVPEHPVRTLLYFETVSSSEWKTPGSTNAFQPNWFVDIYDTLDSKIKALDEYHMEMRPWPHARSIEAIISLAKWRGATIGVQAAEAFVLGRKVVK